MLPNTQSRLQEREQFDLFRQNKENKGRERKGFQIHRTPCREENNNYFLSKFKENSPRYEVVQGKGYSRPIMNTQFSVSGSGWVSAD
jgi:hypothetical protein